MAADMRGTTADEWLLLGIVWQALHVPQIVDCSSRAIRNVDSTLHLHMLLLLVTVAIFAAGVTTMYSLAAVYQRVAVHRSSPMPAYYAEAVAAMMATLGHTARVTLRWEPRSLAIGARVVTWFGRRTLVCSGGLCVAARNDDVAAKCVMAHEIAHLRSHDTLWFAVALTVVVGPLAALFGAPSYVEQDASRSPVPLLATCALMIWLARRRELLADAHAAVVAGSMMDYATLVGSMRAGLFHPSGNVRARHIAVGGGIRRTNVIMLGLCGVIAWRAVRYSAHYFHGYRSDNDPELVISITLWIWPVVVCAMLELVKGPFARSLRPN